MIQAFFGLYGFTTDCWESSVKNWMERFFSKKWGWLKVGCCKLKHFTRRIYTFPWLRLNNFFWVVWVNLYDYSYPNPLTFALYFNRQSHAVAQQKQVNKHNDYISIAFFVISDFDDINVMQTNVKALSYDRRHSSFGFGWCTYYHIPWFSLIHVCYDNALAL